MSWLKSVINTLILIFCFLIPTQGRVTLCLKWSNYISVWSAGLGTGFWLCELHRSFSWAIWPWPFTWFFFLPAIQFPNFWNKVKEHFPRIAPTITNYLQKLQNTHRVLQNDNLISVSGYQFITFLTIATFGAGFMLQLKQQFASLEYQAEASIIRNTW